MDGETKIIIAGGVFGAMLGFFIAACADKDDSTEDKPEAPQKTYMIPNPVVVNSAVAVHVVHIDGIDYLVAERQSGGVAIIPKVIPQPPDPEPPATPPAYP